MGTIRLVIRPKFSRSRVLPTGTSGWVCTKASAMQESGTLDVGFQPEGMHGGALLAVCGTDFVSFFDWDRCKCVRRIDVAAENILWNPAGDMLAIVCKDSVFILKYHRDIVAELYASGGESDEDGIEEAFEIVTEVCCSVAAPKFLTPLFYAVNLCILQQM